VWPFAQSNHPISNGSVLRLEVAGLAAVEAVVVSILYQANVMLALAEAAVALANALLFGLIALHADESFGHGQTLAHLRANEKRSLTVEKSACYLE
jgi:hypothetical protein